VTAARAVVGLGANLGDRRASLALARGRVAAIPGTRVVASSRLYETAPVGPPQPDYLNAAILVECTESLEALMDALLAVEAELGRVRAERFGPRTIDLDLLWSPGRIVSAPRLELPHPRLHERAFALVPLLEVAPGARDPRTGAPYVAPSGELRLVAEAW
jgi:2-amino-4-hydroxy-6-hydroxymethyldihydropteridine diphosphokinase